MQAEVVAASRKYQKVAKGLGWPSKDWPAAKASLIGDHHVFGGSFLASHTDPRQEED
jgi:hypothetical protein